MSLNNVAAIMSQPIVSVSPAMPAWEALELASQHRIHHLAVVDRGGVVGVICTCDLEEYGPTANVGANRQRPPVSTEPGSTPAQALQIMNDAGVGSLLVVQGREVLGIITRRDLQQAGVSMLEDDRGFCSCCGSIAHLREHATGALCQSCLSRSRPTDPVEHGGGD